MAADPSSVYNDDNSIADDEILYRVIRAETTKYSDGVAIRAGTNAFVDRAPSTLAEWNAPAVAVSVLLESEMEKTKRSPQDIVAAWGGDRYGMASITAGEARQANQGVQRDPTESDPEHGILFCLEGPKKTKQESRKLAKASKIVIAPPPNVS